jgi:hypothetical protein
MNRDPSTPARHIKNAMRFRDEGKGAIHEPHFRAVLRRFALLILAGRLFRVLRSAPISRGLCAHDSFAISAVAAAMRGEFLTIRQTTEWQTLENGVGLTQRRF